LLTDLHGHVDTGATFLIGARSPEVLKACRRAPAVRRHAARSSGGAGVGVPVGHHSITSSARARSEGGIVRPSLAAVFRLIGSGNLVGNSTGTCAACAPLRRRSTRPAARSNSSMSGP